jgi:hypothetical protein
MTAAQHPLHPLRFEKVATVEVAVTQPVDLGVGLLGRRRMAAITGGEVTGGWTGTILPGGADWQTVLDDGSVVIEARYPVRLDELGTVCFEVRGVRRPAEPRFCTTFRLTGLPDGAAGASTYVTVGAKDGGVVRYDAYLVDASAAAPQADDPPLQVERRFAIDVDLLPPIDGPATTFGVEQVIPIVGGRVVGPALSADVLPVGADWAIQRSTGALDVHAQYALRAHDGALIRVDNVGHWREREGGRAVYFMTAPVFVAPEGPHRWLTHGVFLAPAVERSIRQVELVVYEVSPAFGVPAMGLGGSVAATGQQASD